MSLERTSISSHNIFRPMKHEWKLSSFDLFTLSMTIKGAWVYSAAPDADLMRSCLRRLLASYPQLGGFYCEEKKAVVWDDAVAVEPLFSVQENTRFSATQLIAAPGKIWKLVRPYDINGFKKGKVLPFSATLLKLRDGAVLYVQCAHATMDGNSFYGLINRWASLCRGESVSPMLVDQSLLPAPDALSREQTVNAVQEKSWVRMDGKKMLGMLLNLVRTNAIKYTVAKEVTQEEISAFKKASGAGTNAVLSAIAAKNLFASLPERTCFKAIFVADLRGHFPGIGPDFFGNFSQALPLGIDFDLSASVEELASAMDSKLKAVLNSDKPEENVRLSFCATNYNLPYFFFDASDMNCPKPGTIYINNQLKFRACELDWGKGLPLYVYPNELTDMVKLWQPVAGGPVQIIYGGLAAKLMRKS